MVDDLSAWVGGLRQLWRSLIPGTIERTLATAVVFATVYFLLVLVVERACGTRTANYRSRGFAHDLAYYLYMKGGLQKYVIPVAFIATLREPLAFLDLKLLEGLPFALKFITWLLAADFVQYWMHRAKHHFRFLWAFHTTHHSQEHVNFATFARIHPVEDLVGQFVHLFLLLILGADPVFSLLVFLVLDMIDQLQHTQIPWRFGPLYGILVMAPFHMYHHSTDPAHYNRNFGVLFSFWDRLFGTAVNERENPKPSRFGLDDVKPTSLWSTLVEPFRLVYRFYAPAGAPK